MGWSNPLKKPGVQTAGEISVDEQGKEKKHIQKATTWSRTDWIVCRKVVEQTKIGPKHYFSGYFMAA